VKDAGVTFSNTTVFLNATAADRVSETPDFRARYRAERGTPPERTKRQNTVNRRPLGSMGKAYDPRRASPEASDNPRPVAGQLSPVINRRMHTLTSLSNAPRRTATVPSSCLVLVAAILAATTATAHAQSVDAPPSVPGNVSARLYSGAGGELFWSRSTDDRGVRGYEITRNGQSLGVRDATSFYDASLRAGTAYTFTVTAIDSAGQRSAAATARIGGTSAPANPLAPVPTTGAPTAPSTPTTPTTAPQAPTAGPVRPGSSSLPNQPLGVRLDIYSNNSYELFWQRVSGAEVYRLTRNGTVVGASRPTSAISQFVTGADLTTDARYTLDAVDGGGRVLAAVSFTVNGTRATPLVVTGTAAAPANPVTPVTPVTPTTPSAPATPATNVPASVLAPRIAIYGSNSYELFWQRLPGVESYLLAGNGVVIGEGGGTSSFFGGADLTRQVRYTLGARDGGGSVIATVRFTVDGTRATPLVVEAIAQPGTTFPGSPQTPSTSPMLPGSALGVRADIYGSNSFELFWQRVAGTQFYRLTRDGNVVDASRPSLAISQYITGADLTRDVRYTLEAVGNFGEVLSSVRFTINGTRATPLVVTP